MDDFELAKALFKQPKDTKSARVVSGTAYADSADGSVQVTIDGSLVTLPTNVSVKDGDTVQVTLSDRSPVVTGVVGRGDEVETEIGDARKVATNYIDYSVADGVVVGNMTEGVLGANTQICVEDDGGVDKATINLRDGSTVLAKFQDDEIDLGMNSSSSVIDLCNGSARLFQTGGFFVIDAGANVIDMKLANSTTAGGHAYWGNVGTTLGTTPNVEAYLEAGLDNSTGKVEAFDHQASGGAFGVRFTGPIHLASYNDPGTAGQVLTSQGAGQTPTWATPASATSYDQLMTSSTAYTSNHSYTLSHSIEDYDLLVVSFKCSDTNALGNARMSTTIPVAEVEKYLTTSNIGGGVKCCEFVYCYPASNPSWYCDVAWGFTDATHLYASRRTYSNMQYWTISSVYGIKF